MTLPPDVAALMATVGVAGKAYQDLSNDRAAQPGGASPWQLLRNVASPLDTRAGSSRPTSSDPGTWDVGGAKRSTARDDAFLVPSFEPNAKRPVVIEDRRAGAAPAKHPWVPGADEARVETRIEAHVEAGVRSQAAWTVNAERDRETSTPRLSLRAQHGEKSAGETSIGTPSREESLSGVLQRVSSWR